MARIVSQAIDELGNLYLLKDDGILEKRTPLNVPLWSHQTKQEPTTGVFVFANAITLDLDNNLWLTYSDTLNIVTRLGSTGFIIQEVLSTATNVIVSNAGGDKIYAISTSRNLLHEISKTAKAIIRSFDLSVLIPGYNRNVFLNQMTSSPTAKIYFGAMIGGTVPPEGGAASPLLTELIKFDPTGNGTFTCFDVTTDIPLQATSSDSAGNIYSADLHGNVYRFVESTSTFDFIYNPPSPGGVIDIVSFTELNQPVLFDDGTFAFAGSKTRTINPANGDTVSTIPGTNVGTVTGDPLGYHHIKITRINILPTPIVPVYDSVKVFARVTADGTISVTGMPTALAFATSVSGELPGPIVLGSSAVNADGSFFFKTAPGVGNPVGGESVTLTAVFGLQTTPLVVLTTIRVLPPVGFTADMTQSPPIVYTGKETRLKFALKDSLNNPIVPALDLVPMARLKHDESGNHFDTNTFVTQNGDFLVLAHDFDGLWFVDVTLPTDFSGSATLYIKDSPAFFANIWIEAPHAEQSTLLDVQSTVNELNDKVDIAFGTPAMSFTDPFTIGGFMVSRINEILKFVKRLDLMIGVDGRAIRIESITTDVDRQTVYVGTTPVIHVTVFDQERRFPVDLAGLEIFLNTKLALTSSILRFSRKGVVIDAANGLAEIRLTEQDTAIAQRLEAQIIIMAPGGVVLASPPFFFDVLPSAV